MDEVVSNFGHLITIYEISQSTRAASIKENDLDKAYQWIEHFEKIYKKVSKSTKHTKELNVKLKAQWISKTEKNFDASKLSVAFFIKCRFQVTKNLLDNEHLNNNLKEFVRCHEHEHSKDGLKTNNTEKYKILNPKSEKGIAKKAKTLRNNIEKVIATSKKNNFPIHYVHKYLNKFACMNHVGPAFEIILASILPMSGHVVWTCDDNELYSSCVVNWIRNYKNATKTLMSINPSIVTEATFRFYILFQFYFKEVIVQQIFLINQSTRSMDDKFEEDNSNIQFAKQNYNDVLNRLQLLLKNQKTKRVVLAYFRNLQLPRSTCFRRSNKIFIKLCNDLKL